jgi:hypothetical protein
MIAITESKFRGETSPRVIVAFDGRRRVAVARKVLAGGWLVVGYGLSWIDKGDKKNVFGIANPSMLTLKNVTQVRNLLNSLK